MQISAELRWFWKESPPSELQRWFVSSTIHSHRCGGGAERTDQYLCDPGQPELGLKIRGGKRGVEVKGLVAVRWGTLGVPPFAGPVELWTKWGCETIPFDPSKTVPIKKLRQLRKFDTLDVHPREIRLGADEKPADGDWPALGCNVELTSVTIPNGDVWWTLGLEAFGPLHTVAESLCATVATLDGRRPPSIGGGMRASYPVWLIQTVLNA